MHVNTIKIQNFLAAFALFSPDSICWVPYLQCLTSCKNKTCLSSQVVVIESDVQTFMEIFIIRILLVLKRSYNFKCGIYEKNSERYRYQSSAFNNNNGETLNIVLSRPSIFRELNISFLLLPMISTHLLFVKFLQ